MNKQSVFYEIKSQTSGKAYYGSTINFKKRVADHTRLLRRNCHHSVHLQNAWKLYGEDDFAFRVIAICEDREFASFLEKRALDKWYNESYNMSTEVTQAHQLSRPLSLERRLKISKKHKGKIVFEETKEKLRIARMRQKSSGMLGKKHTEEVRLKIKLARAKQSPPMKGRTASLQTRQKQSLSKIGKRFQAKIVCTAEACFWGLDYAAKHYGISDVTARKYAKNSLYGWFYANKQQS